jgi:hypothetical protein
MSSYRSLFFTLVFTISSSALISQDKPAGKVSGYVFGDYFYKIGGYSTEVSPSQYSKVEKDFQAFQFRRIYLYYDHIFSEKFSAQFLLEGNDKALEPGGKHGVFVKTAYLEWKEFLPKGSLMFGLVPTPTWSSPGSIAEKTWNYRSIEKTLADYRGLGSASDMGVLLRGKLDGEGTFNYAAMIGNGNGQKPENNKYKKFYASINVKPVKGVLVEGYVDYEPAALEKNKTTLKGFAAYQVEQFTVGVELVQQNQEKAGAAAADRIPFGYTLFTWASLMDGLNAFGRFDWFDPDTKVSNAGYKESFIVVGLDYMPISNVHIMPNVWFNSFSEKASTIAPKDSDVVARLSFYYVYR